MELNVLEILANGCYKSWMLVKVPNGHLHWVFIPRELYTYLKESGVPTAQSFRNKKKDK